jgi:isoquinoline 1-oxidoreductase subunit alpha
LFPLFLAYLSLIFIFINTFLLFHYKIYSMATHTLTINNQQHAVEAVPQMPLLWVIRDLVGLTGTKFGCGMALCGACTIHLDGKPTRSCVLPVSAAVGKSITTIEGVSVDWSHAVQQAWIEHQVPQCGYCQSGQIMSAVALLKTNPKPSDDDIDTAMQGNICRCGTYPRIRQAIHTASRKMAAAASTEPKG